MGEWEELELEGGDVGPSFFVTGTGQWEGQRVGDCGWGQAVGSEIILRWVCGCECGGNLLVHSTGYS